jgi:hypothetical protein
MPISISIPNSYVVLPAAGRREDIVGRGASRPRRQSERKSPQTFTWMCFFGGAGGECSGRVVERHALRVVGTSASALLYRPRPDGDVAA